AAGTGPGDGRCAAPAAGRAPPGARVDVGHADDLGGVPRVDYGGAARHGEHVVGQQRPQGEVLDLGGVGHDAALGLPDELLVLEVALVRVERATGLERDGVQAALGVGQLDLVAHAERAAALLCTGGGGVVGGCVHDGPS